MCEVLRPLYVPTSRGYTNNILSQPSVRDTYSASFASVIVATLDDTKTYSPGILSQQLVTEYEALFNLEPGLYRAHLCYHGSCGRS